MISLGDANDDARMDQHLAAMSLLNKVIQHALGDFKIRNDPVFHRANGNDITGRTAQHVFGFTAYRFDFTVVLVDSYYRRFVDDDDLTISIDQGVRGAQINGMV